jgi:hypothetical protein
VIVYDKGMAQSAWAEALKDLNDDVIWINDLCQDMPSVEGWTVKDWHIHDRLRLYFSFLYQSTYKSVLPCSNIHYITFAKDIRI